MYCIIQKLLIINLATKYGYFVVQPNNNRLSWHFTNIIPLETYNMKAC